MYRELDRNSRHGRYGAQAAQATAARAVRPKTPRLAADPGLAAAVAQRLMGWSPHAVCGFARQGRACAETIYAACYDSGSRGLPRVRGGVCRGPLQTSHAIMAQPVAWVISGPSA